MKLTETLCRAQEKELAIGPIANQIVEIIDTARLDNPKLVGVHINPYPFSSYLRLVFQNDSQAGTNQVQIVSPPTETGGNLVLAPAKLIPSSSATAPNLSRQVGSGRYFARNCERFHPSLYYIEPSPRSTTPLSRFYYSGPSENPLDFAGKLFEASSLYFSSSQWTDWQVHISRYLENGLQLRS